MHALCLPGRDQRRHAAPTIPALVGRLLLLTFVLPIGFAHAGPYTDSGHPPAEMAAWASAVEELVRGPLDLADPTAGFASFGSADDALGAATGDALDAVSLGDAGAITLSFDDDLFNGPGDDLAVYENGFPYLDGLFAELAFVEVGSNGVDFARFPATALNPLPVAAFDPLDPTDYHGLAGRHEIGLGTGFDLADLASHPLVASGDVDLMAVRYVRIVDVVGDGSRLDRASRPILDPHATPFAAGGFDLEAVGALYLVEPTLASALLAGAGGLGLTVPRRRRAARPRPRPLLRASVRRGVPAAVALLAFASMALAAHPVGARTATFDDLGLGSNAALNGSTLAGGFTSGGIFFENQYDAGFDVFTGFAASTMTDATTPGFGNQFSNVTGTGANGSAGFALAYLGGRIVLPEPGVVQGARFTNTTYAALSMRDGDFFSKRFGGATGTDPDYFRLLVEGIGADGASTGTVDLMLADFRFADDGLDFILDEWVFLDLTGLGSVRELRFGFESSDVGPFGINTPTYFALDELVVIPEPGPAVLLGLALGLLARRSHTRR